MIDDADRVWFVAAQKIAGIFFRLVSSSVAADWRAQPPDSTSHQTATGIFLCCDPFPRVLWTPDGAWAFAAPSILTYRAIARAISGLVEYGVVLERVSSESGGQVFAVRGVDSVELPVPSERLPGDYRSPESAREHWEGLVKALGQSHPLKGSPPHIE